jgi:hypothetical protein
MDKVIRDNKVAVLLSRRSPFGWFTRHNKQELLFHPKLVELVEQNKRNEITVELITSILGIEAGYWTFWTHGSEGLDIEWVPMGARFFIYTIDDYEVITVEKEVSWITA